MIMGSYLSIVTLNVNGLNSPTKREDWLNGLKKKKKSLYMVSTRDPSQT